MKKLLLISVLLTTIIAASCGSLPGSAKNEINGTAWTLISFNGESLIKDTAMTAFFEDGQVNGSASCNHYFGSYTNKGDQIQIEGLGWTEMACLNPEGVMDQEQQLMRMFSPGCSYRDPGAASPNYKYYRGSDDLSTGRNPGITNNAYHLSP